MAGEGVGRAGGKDDVVGFDGVVPEDVDGGAVDGGDGSAHDLAAAQEVRVGHEDGVFPHGVNGGAKGGRVMDELVLLLDEDDLREGVEPLGDGNASVSSADDYDACHDIPPFEWTASIVSPRAPERA